MAISNGVKLFLSCKSHLSHVRNYEPGKPLEELEREHGVKNAIKMASNENALGPSPKAAAAVRRTLGRVHRYPDGGCFYLRQSLSRSLGVSGKSLVFGNGSDELLVFAVRAFVEKGDEVIIADPTFLIYEIAAAAENARLVKVPMKEFRYDLEGMARRINRKTKLIFIANPDNPVGTYIPEKRLAAFLRRVPGRVVVVLDEAYYEFARIRKDYPDSLRLLKNFGNLVITRTFSKAYGLSGLRIGYAVTHESIAGALNKVREPFNVNLLAQAGALAALGDRRHLQRTLRMVREGREYLTRELAKLGIPCVDTVTNFVLADLRIAAQPVYEKLLRRGVIVRSMDRWSLKNFIRVTIGKPAENKRFINTLRKVI